MNYIYFLRLLVCFLFGSFYALIFVVVTIYGRHILISPFALTMFASMALGSLLCSFLPGTKKIISSFWLRYGLLALIIAGLSLVGVSVLASQIGFFYYRSALLIVVCASLGFSVGYLKSEAHVRLFQVVHDKLSIAMASGAFFLGVFAIYSFLYPMDIALILNKIHPHYSHSIIVGFMIIALIVIVSFYERYLTLKQGGVKQYSEASPYEHYSSARIQMQLGFLIIIAFQLTLVWSVVWILYIKDVYTENWNHSLISNMRLATSMMLVSFVTIILSGFLIRYLKQHLIFYIAQTVNLVPSLFILLLILILGATAKPLTVIGTLVLIISSVMQIIFYHYYLIQFFKGQLIRAFVPILLGMVGFLISISWVIAPVLILYSNHFLSALVVTLLAIVLFLSIVALNIYPSVVHGMKETKNASD